MAKKKPNNFQWDGEFQSKPKHNPKPGKQSSSGKPSGKPATQHPQNKPAPPKRNLSNQSSAQPAPTPSSPRGGKPNSRYKPQLRAVPVEMYVAAAGNPLAQSLLMTLQDEGKPEDMTNEKFLYRFARYGWNHNETLQGQSMLHLWQTNQSTTSEDELLALYNAKLSALLGTISTTTSEFLRDTLSVKYNSMLVNTDEIFDDPQRYASFLEVIFGYEIQFAVEFTNKDEQLRQLDALAKSNLLIVNYFNSIGLNGPDIFERYFSESGKITVHLGDDIKVAELNPESQAPEYEGNTPRFDDVDRYKIYLGSYVSVATITHEFFHQLDRSFGNLLAAGQNESIISLERYLNSVAVNTLNNSIGLPYDRDAILAEGGASDVRDPAEYFPDFGMTAVLNGLGETVSPFGDSPVIAFADSQNARDVECALRQYFIQLFTGSRTHFVYEPCS